MQNYRRLFISALLIAFLVGSFLSPLNTKPAYACPAEPPQTLLDLYLGSDLVVVADVISEEIVSREEGAEAGDWAEIKKNFDVVTIYKGTPPDDLTFNRSEYAAPVTDESGVETGRKERWNALLPGNRYMLFLQKDKDSGEYQLAPSFSSFRKIEAANEKLYDQRLTELESIIKAKKDQLPALTEWLVRLIEESETRYDGVADIRYSFQGLNYQGGEEEADEEKGPFLLQDYSDVQSSHVAESLTESQKQRISAVLERQLQAALSAGDDDEGSSLDYDLVNLVTNWDLDQMTMRVNAMIQNSDPTDSKRINILMSFITYAFYDEELSTLSYSYRATAETENLDDMELDENEDEAEAIVETEMPVETAPVVFPTPEVTENVVETLPVEQVTTEGTANVAETAPAEPEIPAEVESKPALDPEAARLKRVKLLTGLVRKFNDRYQYLLAKGFKTDDDEAKTEEVHLDKRVITTK
jgi:hypothetical protein